MDYTDLNKIIEEGKKYNIICADPPWQYRDKCKAGKRGASFKYPTMKLKDIKDLPIGKISNNNSALFLWVTFPFLKEGLEVIESWGYTYKTLGFVWIKLNKIMPTLFWGMGGQSRSNAELCLLATKGKIKRINIIKIV